MKQIFENNRRYSTERQLNERGYLYLDGKKKGVIVEIINSRFGGVGIKVKNKQASGIKIGDKINLEMMVAGKYQEIEFVVRHITVDGFKTKIGLQYADQTTLSPRQREIMNSNK